jgi:hypothetical protein
MALFTTCVYFGWLTCFEVPKTVINDGRRAVEIFTHFSYVTSFNIDSRRKRVYVSTASDASAWRSQHADVHHDMTESLLQNAAKIMDERQGMKQRATETLKHSKCFTTSFRFSLSLPLLRLDIYAGARLGVSAKTVSNVRGAFAAIVLFVGHNSNWQFGTYILDFLQRDELNRDSKPEYWQ